MARLMELPYSMGSREQVHNRETVADVAEGFCGGELLGSEWLWKVGLVGMMREVEEEEDEWEGRVLSVFLVGWLIGGGGSWLWAMELRSAMSF